MATLDEIKRVMSDLGRRAGKMTTPAQTTARRLNMARAREYLLAKRKPRT